jgi:hypothetical protein
MRIATTVILSLLSSAAGAQQHSLPIIDVHLHAARVEDFAMLAGEPPIPHCVPMTDYPVPASGAEWNSIMRSRDLPCRATWSPANDREVMEQTLAVMKRRNIVGVVSGPNVGQYAQAAPERVIASLSFGGGPDTMSADAVREALRTGRYAVLGEVTAQYGGMAPDDPVLAPYWALAEELDIPVGIHIGTGPVGAPYLRAFARYRARLHSALGLEEVLLLHPKLRVYIMHAGWPMLEDLLALLWAHPQVYVDTGAISWALPRAEFHRYLQRIVEAGFGKRVLFGSDQMIWPETIEMALEGIESAAFLSDEQKRNILYANAARFLRLSEETVARHHDRKE